MHRLNAMVKNICQMHKCINSNISTSVLMRDYIFCSAHSSQRVNVYGNLFQGIMVILLMTRQWMDVIFCVLSRKGSYFHATLCLWLCLFLQGGRSAVQHWQHAWSEEEEDHSSGQRSGEKPTAKPQKVYLSVHLHWDGLVYWILIVSEEIGCNYESQCITKSEVQKCPRLSNK